MPMLTLHREESALSAMAKQGGWQDRECYLITNLVNWLYSIVYPRELARPLAKYGGDTKWATSPYFAGNVWIYGLEGEAYVRWQDLIHVTRSGPTGVQWTASRGLCLSNLQMNKPGTGQLTNFLSQIAEQLPPMVLAVENVNSAKLGYFLFRQGFVKMDETTRAPRADCWIRYPQLLLSSGIPMFAQHLAGHQNEGP
jgi:hypothetical protein